MRSPGAPIGGAESRGGVSRMASSERKSISVGSDVFETVVCTLAICDVDDRAAVLAEAHRVIRPGGSLLLLDHLEPRWRRGRPATLGERAGFEFAERQRLWAGYIERVRLQKRGG